MEKKFEIVFVSKDTSFKYDKLSAEKFSKKNPSVKFEYVENNTQPTTVVYNSYIKKHREAKDIDYLILMHADVTLDFKHFLNHIEEVGKTKNYVAMGLCGCAQCSVSNTPLNWFNASRGYENYRWGSVIHGELNNARSFWNFHTPNVTDHSVAMIDGLGFILTKKLLEETDILFDEQFSYSGCYDTDFSLECVMKRKLPLGVLVEPSLNHYSVGKSIFTKEFAEAEIKLRNKWKFKIPEQLTLRMKQWE